MDTDRARLISERLQAGDREEDGTPLLQHFRLVAHEVAAEAAARSRMPSQSSKSTSRNEAI
jgi:hypothetical protein